MYELYDTPSFDEAYFYPGSDLGASYTPEKTTFRLWAPTAQEVSVNLYATGREDGSDLLGQIPMTPDVQGTWVAQREGDLHGVYYTYLVMVDGVMEEASDPYAKAAGVNGKRSMVIDLKSTDPEGWREEPVPPRESLTDAVICEVHIRDFTIHPSSRHVNRGKYLGLTEAGRKTPGGHSTGIDHLLALGVTHVQLMPIFDFGFSDEKAHLSDYNWGYDPVNYNLPEGSYSSDPAKGQVRIGEVKAMVKALHQRGLRVVMDVVYNHVYHAPSFSFNKIVPGYFSRISPQGVYSNGSACGNDTATLRPMVRKFIVDSLVYWAQEYHMDGFRFDLAGLMDVETIRQAMAAVRAIRPGAVFYGEGWALPTQMTRPGGELAVQANARKLPEFAFFNDTIRDAMRGSVFSTSQLGFAAGGRIPRSTLDCCFLGRPYWAQDPCQCINYISCHDNHTLLDRICLSAPDAPRQLQVKMHNLAAAFSILSQGVPFFLAGEEMLRTKPGRKEPFDGNSYRSPDKVNSIKWNTLDKEEVQQNVAYYAGLIAFRKSHTSLRLGGREEVSAAVRPVPHENPHVAAYHITGKVQETFAIFNSDMSEISIQLPPGAWGIFIDGEHAGTELLKLVQNQVTVPPTSPLVLSRKRRVEVVAALLWEKDKVLVCQRPAGDPRAMKWEFVGGKVEPGETKEQALARECLEELGIEVEVGREFMQTRHDYPDMRIRLTTYHAFLRQGRPQKLEHAAIRWVHPRDLSKLDFCQADLAIASRVQQVYGWQEPL